jgi:hypothetical protein
LVLFELGLGLGLGHGSPQVVEEIILFFFTELLFSDSNISIRKVQLSPSYYLQLKHLAEPNNSTVINTIYLKHGQVFRQVGQR